MSNILLETKLRYEERLIYHLILPMSVAFKNLINNSYFSLNCLDIYNFSKFP